MNKEEFKEIENLFIENSNPDKIDKMTAYMKGRFKYLGISAPERKEILKSIFLGFKWKREEMLEFAGLAWKSEYRELQYAGLDILHKHSKKIAHEDIAFLEQLVTTHSWWDTVDSLAVNPIGKTLKQNEALKRKWVLSWAASDNMWLKRTAILHQLKYKNDVDTELMEHCIKQANGTSEFFLNKAIGWMLREYSRTDPAYVRSYCEENKLSNLSRREALRLL